MVTYLERAGEWSYGCMPEESVKSKWINENVDYWLPAEKCFCLWQAQYMAEFPTEQRRNKQS
jgi:hypothetical protein